MSDRIVIRGLSARAILGVLPDERTNQQPVIIDLTLSVDTSAAAASDDLQDAIDYADIADRMIEHAETSEYLLVERLAEQLATLCLEDQRIQKVRVSVRKPTALRLARSVGISIERHQRPNKT